MSTPAVTITGNMKLLTGGNDAGSVVFCLVNYGNVVPRIVGTTVIVQTSVTAQADASGNFSIVLWGNDVIIPAGTYYELDFRSDTGVTVQKVPYSFTGSGSFDISTQTPLIPPSNHPTPTNGLFTATSAGLTPASGGGTTNFLRADGTFAAPSATGGFTAFTPVSHQFLTGVNVSGVFSAAQPAAADLSNGTTGTGGAVVLATAAALTDPVVNTLNVTGNSALGVSGTGGQIAGGFASPSVIRHYLGDGTGWRIEFAKRAASVDTLEAWITDGGVFNIVTGIQINGAAASGNVLRGNGTNFIPAVLAAADLSNGTTGSGHVVLDNTPTLITPNIGAATGTSLNVSTGTITAGIFSGSNTQVGRTGNLSSITSGNSVFFGHSNTQYVGALGANNTSGLLYLDFYAYQASGVNQHNYASGTNKPLQIRVMDTTAPSGGLQILGAAAGTVDTAITFSTMYQFLNNTTNPTFTLGTDTGISRSAAGVIAVGNGTAGDITGTVKVATLSLPTTSNTLPASIANDTAGGINLLNNAGKGIQISSGANIFMNQAGAFLSLSGATSGTTNIQATSVASGTLTLPAATDTLVGKATTDSMSNKTLIGATSGNSVTLLNYQSPTGTLTGNAADQVVFTYTLPANTMQAGKGIRITTYVNHTTGSAVITYKVNFGGVVYTTTTPTDTAVAAERYCVTLFNNAGVTNVQNGVAEVFSGGAYGIGSLSSSAIDTTAAVVITLTFNAANTQQVQGRLWMVELLQ